MDNVITKKLRSGRLVPNQEGSVLSHVPSRRSHSSQHQRGMRYFLNMDRKIHNGKKTYGKLGVSMGMKFAYKVLQELRREEKLLLEALDNGKSEISTILDRVMRKFYEVRNAFEHLFQMEPIGLDRFRYSEKRLDNYGKCFCDFERSADEIGVKETYEIATRGRDKDIWGFLQYLRGSSVENIFDQGWWTMLERPIGYLGETPECGYDEIKPLEMWKRLSKEGKKKLVDIRKTDFFSYEDCLRNGFSKMVGALRYLKESLDLLVIYSEGEEEESNCGSETYDSFEETTITTVTETKVVTHYDYDD